MLGRACFLSLFTGLIAISAMADAQESEDIKEYHFHTYFIHTNADSRAEAEAFHAKLHDAVQDGRFIARPGSIAYGPRGPHMIGNFYSWVPAESFQKVYSFYILHRGNMTVLIHPLTKFEVADHSVRASWMGTPLPLDPAWLQPELTRVPLEYPELGLGYSAKEN